MEIKKYPFVSKLYFSLIALLLASCKKEVPTSIGNVSLPVVQAYLVPGNVLTVKLYRQKAITDTAKYGAAITGQQVYVSNGTTNVLLTETKAGTYTYNDPAFLATGNTYTLQFKYLSYNVSAKTVMPAKAKNFTTSLGTIGISGTTSTTPGTTDAVLDTLKWDNPDSTNHILVFLNADEKDFPLGNGFGGGGGRPYDFTINTDQSSYFYLTQNVFPYYGPYQIILFSVNQEYIDVLNSNTSGSTSSNLTNVPTNIVNGFGIFTAMQADTVSLNVFN